MGNVIEENLNATDEERANVACVRSIYRAFLEGNIEQVLNSMREDVRVVGTARGSHERPYARSFEGRAELAQGFAEFNSIVRYQRPTAPVRLIAKGNRVLAIGQELREERASGDITENRWSMLWIFTDGKVSELRVLEDTVEALP